MKGRRRFEVIPRPDGAWQINGPELTTAAKRLPLAARHALLQLNADLPPEAKQFIFDAMFGAGPRGHRRQKNPDAVAAYQAAPRGRKGIAATEGVVGDEKSYKRRLAAVRKQVQRAKQRPR
jgi:hypothetical protein